MRAVGRCGRACYQLARMARDRTTPDRERRGRAWQRALAVAAAAAALFLQIFVVQTHMHAQAAFAASGHERLADPASDGQALLSEAHEQAACIVCKIFASSSRTLAPGGFALSAGPAAAHEAAAQDIPSPPRAPTHTWRSRAPPIVL